MPEPLPAGDVLLHCGDMTNVGTAKEIKSVNEWFGQQSHPIKIAIAGNHDIGLDVKQYDELWERFHRNCKSNPAENIRNMTNITLLWDESIVLDSGIKIYGSPYTPEFCGWAFSLKSA